jgi:hypothetical protein
VPSQRLLYLYSIIRINPKTNLGQPEDERGKYAMTNEKSQMVENTNPEIPFQRSRIYELLSFVFEEPADEFLRFLSTREFLVYVKDRMKNLLHAKDIGYKELDKITELVKCSDSDLIISEYEGLASPHRNYFYECNYHAPANAMEEMADIAGFYRAFGVASECERPDYLPAELEFMRLLAIKETRALMDDDATNIEICRSAQREFLDAHLGRWVKGLSIITDCLKFYGLMCRFLNNWIDAECRYLSATPSESFYIANCNFNENDFEFCSKETGEYERI